MAGRLTNGKKSVCWKKLIHAGAPVKTSILTLVFAICLVDCALLQKLGGSKKQSGPPAIPRISGPNIRQEIVRKLEAWLPHSEEPEQLDMHLSGAIPWRITVATLGQGWSIDGPVRADFGGAAGHLAHFKHAKTGAEISLAITAGDNADAFRRADALAAQLPMFGAVVLERRHTNYQNVDDVRIHRADIACFRPHVQAMDPLQPADCAGYGPTPIRLIRHTFVSFHDRRLALAISPVVVSLRSEWTPGDERTVAAALYRLTGFMRIRQELH